MRILWVLFLSLVSIASSAQTLDGFNILDPLQSAVHPSGCTDEHVTGMPDNLTWVNFSSGDMMTGSFSTSWSDGVGPDLLLETSFHPDNYEVRLLLADGSYSDKVIVTVDDWTNIAFVGWDFVFANGCGQSVSNGDSRHYIRLDFLTDFSLSPDDGVVGIEIVFLFTTGATDLAGVYIIGEEIVPIELINFELSSVRNEEVEISWQTASEINNDYFVVQKSSDGYTWEDLRIVEGAGNSSTQISYSTTDFNPFENWNYYRLKQVDFDGKYEYSSARSIEIFSLESDLKVYPNPTTDKITFELDDADVDEILVYDVKGREVTALTDISLENESEVRVQLSELERGIYWIKTKTQFAKVFKK